MSKKKQRRKTDRHSVAPSRKVICAQGWGLELLQVSVTQLLASCLDPLWNTLS